MISHIMQAVTTLKLEKQGVTNNLVGVYSLRTGGTMAMKLNGASDTKMMEQGQWWSLTFLHYIYNQIVHLSNDFSQKMSTKLVPFQNIAAIQK